MKVDFVSAAERELDEAVAYFEAQRAGLGLLFAAEVAAAVARIEAYPRAWQRMPGGVRRCLLRKFQYGLVYRVQGDTAVVYAVMHLRRRPTYWRSRPSRSK